MTTALSFNKVILVGRLSKDPRTHTFADGQKVTTIRIAINSEWDKKNGEKEKDVFYINCEAWGSMAENISEWFKKGRPILVEGRLANEKEWTNKEGKIIREMKIKIRKWEFMDDKKEQNNSGDNGDEVNSNSIPESAGNCGTGETSPEDFDSIVEDAVSSD